MINEYILVYIYIYIYLIAWMFICNPYFQGVLLQQSSRMHIYKKKKKIRKIRK